ACRRNRATCSTRARRLDASSADAGTGERVGGPLALGQRLGCLGAAVAAEPGGERVDAGDQVVVHRRVAVRRRPGVARRLECETGAVELATGVVLVAGERAPAVL